MSPTHNIVVFKQLSTFIQRDIDLLNATPYQYHGLWHELMFFISHCFDRYFIWFCDNHALVPILIARIRRRPSYIFVGGFDAQDNTPTGLFYGKGLKKRIRRMIAMWCYRLCTRIYPVDFLLTVFLIKKGIPQRKIRTVYFGLNLDEFQINKNHRLIDFLTVGDFSDKRTRQRKGYYRFIQLARLMPGYRFAIIGTDEVIKDVYTLRLCHIEEVKYYMNLSKVYCHLSEAEGMPVAMMEAMAMGCTPVGTRVNGIPQLIGDTGVITDDPLPGDLLKALKMKSDPRKRIAENFSYTRRKEALNEADR